MKRSEHDFPTRASRPCKDAAYREVRLYEYAEHRADANQIQHLLCTYEIEGNLTVTPSGDMVIVAVEPSFKDDFIALLEKYRIDADT